MPCDAHVETVGELRVFASAAVAFGREMAADCQRAIALTDEARRSADYLRNMVRHKVEAAEQQLAAARQALDSYESSDHTDREGNSTYDAAYAARLRQAVDNAEAALRQAREDQALVEDRYNSVRQAIADMASEMSAATRQLDESAARTGQHVMAAAARIDAYAQTR